MEAAACVSRYLSWGAAAEVKFMEARWVAGRGGDKQLPIVKGQLLTACELIGNSRNRIQVVWVYRAATSETKGSCWHWWGSCFW